jgi:hypothetical protein
MRAPFAETAIFFRPAPKSSGGVAGLPHLDQTSPPRHTTDPNQRPPRNLGNHHGGTDCNDSPRLPAMGSAKLGLLSRASSRSSTGLSRGTQAHRCFPSARRRHSRRSDEDKATGAGCRPCNDTRLCRPTPCDGGSCRGRRRSLDTRGPYAEGKRLDWSHQHFPPGGAAVQRKAGGATHQFR